LESQTPGRAATRFKPGHAPVKNDMRVVFQTKRIFAVASSDLAEELIALALCATDERVKAVCLVACLGMAGIKPHDFDPENERKAVGRQSAKLEIDRLSTEERAELRRLLLLATPVESEASL
jgi:hypothetical protein